MITQIRNTCSNGARTLKIHQDGAAPELNRLTLATGGQLALMSRGTRGHKSTTTVYNQPTTDSDIKNNAMECRRACKKED